MLLTMEIPASKATQSDLHKSITRKRRLQIQTPWQVTCR